MSIEIREDALRILEKQLAIRSAENLRDRNNAVAKTHEKRLGFQKEVSKLKNATQSLIARSRAPNLPPVERQRDLARMQKSIAQCKQSVAKQASDLKHSQEIITGLSRQQQKIEQQQQKIYQLKMHHQTLAQQALEESALEETSVITLLKDRGYDQSLSVGSAIGASQANSVDYNNAMPSEAFTANADYSLNREKQFSDSGQQSSSQLNGENSKHSALEIGLDLEQHTARKEQADSGADQPQVAFQFRDHRGASSSVALSLNQSGEVTVNVHQSQPQSRWINSQQERTITDALLKEGIGVDQVNIQR